jgi:uncharacterized protein YlxW (UPF0749 family)
MRRPSIPLTRLRPAVVIAGLAAVAAGMMFAAAASTSQGTDLRAERAVELRDLVRERATRVDNLEESVAALQRQVDDLTEGRVGDPAAIAARTGIQALQATAGTTELTGRSLTVTLDDAPLRGPDDPMWQTLTPDDVIVHQEDVQAVVNSLWRGGAKGIQVMDQRLIATSSIQCVGNTLLLQGRVYSPPYVITAIGPVKKMRASLRDDPIVAAYRDWAGAVGLGYDLKRKQSTTIPGFEGPIAMDFATPGE